MILPRLVYMLEKAEARYNKLSADLGSEARFVFARSPSPSPLLRRAELVSAEVSTWPRWKRGGSAVPR